MTENRDQDTANAPEAGDTPDPGFGGERVLPSIVLSWVLAFAVPQTPDGRGGSAVLVALVVLRAGPAAPAACRPGGPLRVLLLVPGLPVWGLTLSPFCGILGLWGSRFFSPVVGVGGLPGLVGVCCGCSFWLPVFVRPGLPCFSSAVCRSLSSRPRPLGLLAWGLRLPRLPGSCARRLRRRFRRRLRLWRRRRLRPWRRSGRAFGAPCSPWGCVCALRRFVWRLGGSFPVCLRPAVRRPRPCCRLGPWLLWWRRRLRCLRLGSLPCWPGPLCCALPRPGLRLLGVRGSRRLAGAAPRALPRRSLWRRRALAPARLGLLVLGRPLGLALVSRLRPSRLSGRFAAVPFFSLAPRSLPRPGPRGRGFPSPRQPPPTC
jgi:hypothetical protein